LQTATGRFLLQHRVPRLVARRVTVDVLRAMEAFAWKAARKRWKIDRFNRLIEADVRTTGAHLRNRGVEAIVGIPFHKEASNIARLIETLQHDLESRGLRAAIVVVSERKTRDLLLDLPLPESSGSVTVTRLLKPHGFGQKPGLSRRSWSHWFVFQIARECNADVVFIDADVRNASGWVPLYLDAIQRDATVAVADYVRNFGHDDAIVHLWDRLLFGALFKKWVAFRHGGDYAVSRRFVQTLASDHSIMRERSYTLDSAVIARAVSSGGRLESVWLGAKEHEPISTAALFRRLPDLVRSVFEDIAAHLPRLLRVPQIEASPESGVADDDAISMKELIGTEFRQDLWRDMTERFHQVASHIRRTAGASAFNVIGEQMTGGIPHNASLPPRLWARLTLRFLMRYIRNPDPATRDKLVNAYVPLLELGILGFLNQTFELSYAGALRHLQQNYLPEFQQIWNGLARRLPIYRWAALRRWPVSVLRKLLHLAVS
jgi:hypothetical protein